jgi:hypothetical protein
MGFLFLKIVTTVSFMLLQNIEVAIYASAYIMSQKLDHKVTHSLLTRHILLRFGENYIFLFLVGKKDTSLND